MALLAASSLPDYAHPRPRHVTIAMINRFTGMNDALSNIFIATLLFRRILVALTYLPLSTHTIFTLHIS